MQALSRKYRSFSTQFLAFLICCALLLSSLMMAGSSHASISTQGQSRGGKPEAGPPATSLPNLDDVRRKQHPKPQAPPHIPSLMRGKRKPLEPRNDRKVGDPGTTGLAFIGTAGVPPASVSEARAAGSTAQKHVGESGTSSGPPPASVITSHALKAKLNHSRRSSSFLSPTGLA